MNYQALADLLVSEGIGPAVPAGTAAQQLNTPSVSRYRTLTGHDLRLWAGANDLVHLLDDDAKGGGNGNSATRGKSQLAMMLLQAPDTALDLNEAEQLALVQTMPDSVIPQAAKDDLLARATELVSPATAAGLGEVTEGDINHVRAG